jgi:pSer/pThr/pTyr-binding forkhead associated (FHA) protein
LISSQRRKFDGSTYFGSLELYRNGEICNDLVIPEVDTGIGRKHMAIKYNKIDKSYYLQDLGEGTGTFVRLDV